MTITILTLFPEVFVDIFASSIIGRAQKKSFLKIQAVNIRDFATDKHKSVDDRPYGGGAGMLLRVDIIHRAIQAVKVKNIKEKVILFDPKGKKFNQKTALSFSKLQHLILVCGHYEGVDYRVKNFIDGSISIGDYILTGGEIPAMAIADCVTRLIPGVLSKKESIMDESFSRNNYYEAPQYTRPLIFKGLKVPKILLSGNHRKIKEWKDKHTTKI